MKKMPTKKVTHMPAKKVKDAAYYDEIILKPAKRLLDALLSAKRKKSPVKLKTTAQSR